MAPRILRGFFLVLAWCLSRSARSELAGWVTPPPFNPGFLAFNRAKYA